MRQIHTQQLLKLLNDYIYYLLGTYNRAINTFSDFVTPTYILWFTCQSADLRDFYHPYF